MDKLDIILWVVSGVFGIFFTLMMFMWHAINSKFEQMEARFDKIDGRFDKIAEIITDIDRRLCRLEGAFSNKDCCVIKESNQQRKAE